MQRYQDRPFADAHYCKKIEVLGEELAEMDSHIDFAALAMAIDTALRCPVSTQGEHLPYPTETMVRIVVLKRFTYNLPVEQMAYQLLDRMSDKRFYGLANAAHISGDTTV